MPPHLDGPEVLVAEPRGRRFGEPVLIAAHEVLQDCAPKMMVRSALTKLAFVRRCEMARVARVDVLTGPGVRDLALTRDIGAA